MEELTNFRLVLLIQQIDTTHQQLPFADLRFPYQSEFVIPFEVIDDLHNRTQLLREAVENDCSPVFGQPPPLPVAMKFGGKIRQRRMFWIAENPRSRFQSCCPFLPGI